MKAFKNVNKKKKLGVQSSLLSAVCLHQQRCPYFYFISNLFIKRPYLLETKTTNYCANNVGCGGHPFHAWFIFVWTPPWSFVLPPVPVSACLASWPWLLPTVFSSCLIYMILHRIWMTTAERRGETWSRAGSQVFLYCHIRVGSSYKWKIIWVHSCCFPCAADVSEKIKKIKLHLVLPVEKS